MIVSMDMLFWVWVKRGNVVVLVLFFGSLRKGYL